MVKKEFNPGNLYSLTDDEKTVTIILPKGLGMLAIVDENPIPTKERRRIKRDFTDKVIELERHLRK